MNEVELDAVLENWDQEFSEGRLMRVALDWPAVWEREEKLSAAYARETLARTLDILHVAAALQLGCVDFVSFDRRQRALATLAGLNVLPAILPT